jgi:hypothetical protein
MKPRGGGKFDPVEDFGKVLKRLNVAHAGGNPIGAAGLNAVRDVAAGLGDAAKADALRL